MFEKFIKLYKSRYFRDYPNTEKQGEEDDEFEAYSLKIWAVIIIATSSFIFINPVLDYIKNYFDLTNQEEAAAIPLLGLFFLISIILITRSYLNKDCH